jgi:hypothetical protein
MSRPGRRVSLTVDCVRGLGRTVSGVWDGWDTTHHPVPNGFGELSRRSAAIRTCPTAPVPPKVQGTRGTASRTTNA